MGDQRAKMGKIVIIRGGARMSQTRHCHVPGGVPLNRKQRRARAKLERVPVHPAGDTYGPTFQRR